MIQSFVLRTRLLFFPLLLTPVAHLAAQPPPNPVEQAKLFKTIASLDAAVFDAYNKCDIEKFGSFFTEDLEFYHDQGGLMVGRQNTIDAVKNNVCGKARRDLVPGTLAVFPLNGYGAVETGIHLFCDPKLGKCPDGSGVARFTHIWQNKDGAWRITRVISYDHCSRCSTSRGPDFRVAP